MVKQVQVSLGPRLTEDWLAEKGIAKTKLQAVNNAGLTALLFADFLGPSGIILIGMDLAGGGRLTDTPSALTSRTCKHIPTISIKFGKLRSKRTHPFSIRLAGDIQ